MRAVNTLILLGKPGSGKGTQAQLLFQDRFWVPVATGDFFRDLGKREDDLGERVRAVYDTGALLPSFFTTHFFVREMMSLPTAKGAVFDGFGRSARQAKEAHEVFGWFGRTYLAVNLEVNDEIIVQRIKERNAIQARTDSDTPEKVRRRLAEYRERSEPALTVFEANGVLRRINAQRSPETVHREITALLK